MVFGTGDFDSGRGRALRPEPPRGDGLGLIDRDNGASPPIPRPMHPFRKGRLSNIGFRPTTPQLSAAYTPPLSSPSSALALPRNAARWTFAPPGTQVTALKSGSLRSRGFKTNNRTESPPPVREHACIQNFFGGQSIRKNCTESEPEAVSSIGILNDTPAHGRPQVSGLARRSMASSTRAV